MNKDPFKEYIKESEPAKRDKGLLIRRFVIDIKIHKSWSNT